MHSSSLSGTATSTGLVGRLFQLRNAVASLPISIVTFFARISMAAVFWLSGQTKLDGLMVSDSALYLFEHEYKLPLINPSLAAHLATFAEHFFPLLLVIGLASRLSAFALLVMTLTIQIFVYPGAWPTHGTWAACLLAIIIAGPGPLSLDHLIARRAAQMP